MGNSTLKLHTPSTANSVSLVYHYQLSWQEHRLERSARKGLDAKHGFLLEARFIGRDNFLNGMVRCSIIPMNKAQDIRGLANHFAGSRSPLAGRLPGRKSIGKARGDYFTKKFRPSFRCDMS